MRSGGMSLDRWTSLAITGAIGAVYLYYIRVEDF